MFRGASEGLANRKIRDKCGSIWKIGLSYCEDIMDLQEERSEDERIVDNHEMEFLSVNVVHRSK